VLYACKGAHTLFTGQREGKKGRGREIETETEGERERCRICPELFLFLKGLAVGTFVI
jgi:hypothetical protein